MKPRILTLYRERAKRDCRYSRYVRARLLATALGKSARPVDWRRSCPPLQWFGGCVATVTVHYQHESITRTGIVYKLHGLVSEPRSKVVVFIDSPTNPYLLWVPLMNPIIEVSMQRLPLNQRRRNLAYLRYRLVYFRTYLDQWLGSKPGISRTDWVKGKWPPAWHTPPAVGVPPKVFQRAFAKASASVKAWTGPRVGERPRALPGHQWMLASQRIANKMIPTWDNRKKRQHIPTPGGKNFDP